MREHPVAETERPADMETKDTRGTLLGYIPSTVPNLTRTGSELTEEERKLADDRLRDDRMSGVSEEEHKRAQFGLTTDSADTQTTSAAGSTESTGTTSAPKRSGGARS